MPHLARRLVLVGLRGERFEPIARLNGISNHRIGEDFVTGGLRDCGSGPELLLPSADWRRILRVTYEGGRLVAQDHGAFTDARALEARSACPRRAPAQSPRRPYRRRPALRPFTMTSAG